MMAADQGHGDAQYNTGYCFEKGEGTEVDLEQALKYYKMAAEQDIDGAQSKVDSLDGSFKKQEEEQMKQLLQSQQLQQIVQQYHQQNPVHPHQHHKMLRPSETQQSNTAPRLRAKPPDRNPSIRTHQYERTPSMSRTLPRTLSTKVSQSFVPPMKSIVKAEASDIIASMNTVPTTTVTLQPNTSTDNNTNSGGNRKKNRRKLKDKEKEREMQNFMNPDGSFKEKSFEESPTVHHETVVKTKSKERSESPRKHRRTGITRQNASPGMSNFETRAKPT